MRKSPPLCGYHCLGLSVYLKIIQYCTSSHSTIFIRTWQNDSKEYFEKEDKVNNKDKKKSMRGGCRVAIQDFKMYWKTNN